jgi:hypothetical protein
VSMWYRFLSDLCVKGIYVVSVERVYRPLMLRGTFQSINMIKVTLELKVTQELLKLLKNY